MVRVRVDGDVFDIDQVPELAPQRAHTIEAIVDRIIIRPGIEARLAESIELAVQNGEGLIIATYLESPDASPRDGNWIDRLFNTEYSCPRCGISYEEVEPRTFSFNSPFGACPECDGLGRREQFDPELIHP